MILHLHESGNFHNDSVAYRRRFIDRTDVIKISFQEHLAKANRNILKCVSADDQSKLQNYILTVAILTFVIK